MRHGPLSDKQYEERQRSLRNARERQRDEDILRLMADDGFRALMYWVIYELCELEEHSIDLAVKDGVCAAVHAGWRDGRRYAGRRIKERLRHIAGESYLAMKSEGELARQPDVALMLERIRAQELESAGEQSE